MSKPYLIIVTGRPGSGKTTFAKKLGEELYMPVVSRDQLKEGYVRSFGRSHAELPGGANGVVTRVFFDTLKLLAAGNVSVIAEAAFQNRVWSPMLEWFSDRVRMYLLICKVDDRVAQERYIKRGMDDRRRVYFHGDPGVDAFVRGDDGVAELKISPYDEPRLDAPTFHIDTKGHYSPSIRELTDIILRRPGA